MRKLTLLLYVILLGAIVYLGACLAVAPLREATIGALGMVSSSLAIGFAAVTTPVASSPIYLQWSWLIWLCVGWFTLAIGILLWRKRPSFLVPPKKLSAPQTMGEPQTIIIRETPQPTGVKQPEPKKEEPKSEAAT